MKHFLLFFALLLIDALPASAQNNNLKINGVVIDSAEHKPLEFVTVALKYPDGIKTLKSALTNDKGIFQLNVPEASGKPWRLVISYVGYPTKSINISGDSTAINLGNIALAGATSQLKTVSVVATKALVKQEIDRISYDVQADPQSKALTAMDMMRRVPLLTVDGDDNIQLQGSGDYRIFINGKPSALLTNNPKDVLRTMPANIILRIEVITNPPAKYDSEGLAGIINIITTKKTDDGYSGTLTSRYSYPWGPNVNATATAKQDKFGISGYASVGNQPVVSTGQGNILQTFGAKPSVLSQQGNGSNGGKYLSSSMELSYTIDTLHLLTASSSFNTGRFIQNYDRSSVFYMPGSSPSQSYLLLNAGGNRWEGADASLNYEAGFRHQKGRLLTASYRYAYYSNNQYNNTATQQRFNYDQPDNNQQNEAASKEQTIQVDYTHPLKKLTIEAGAKTILRDNTSNSSGQYYKSATAGFVNDTSRINNFDYRQDVYSLYNSYALKLSKWAFQGGVRAERTTVNADFASNKASLTMDYTNVVPTLSIMKSLKNNGSITFGITNRLQRPGIQQLNPFVDRTNPQVITTGNPQLRPVISHLFELSYTKSGTGSLTTRVSYMYTNNNIEQVTKIVADTLSVTSFENVGHNKMARFNISGNYPLTAKWNINFNSVLFYVWTSGTFNGIFYSNKGPRTNTFANTTYKLDKGWLLGMSGGYNRRYITLQGSSNDYYYYSLSLTKSIHNFTLTGVLNNPLHTNYLFKLYNKTDDFYQSNSRNMIYRTYSFSLSYKFGGLNSSIKKNKHGINNDDTTSGGN